MMRTPPVLMYRPAWRAGPPGSPLRHWGRGPGSHPGLIPPEPLRLLRDGLEDCGWNWGLLLLLWSAKPDSGPQVGPTSGTYHICSHRGKVLGLTVDGNSGVCSLSDWTRAQG